MNIMQIQNWKSLCNGLCWVQVIMPILLPIRQFGLAQIPCKHLTKHNRLYLTLSITYNGSAHLEGWHFTVFYHITWWIMDLQILENWYFLVFLILFFCFQNPHYLTHLLGYKSVRVGIFFICFLNSCLLKKPNYKTNFDDWFDDGWWCLIENELLNKMIYSFFLLGPKQV